MVDLNDNEQKVVNAMKEIGATNGNSAKTADMIAAKCPLAKGMVTNLLMQLQNKKAVKRISKSKAAVYHLVQQP